MIRVGIGGWTFADWRGTFYPKGLPHARELTYAASVLTTIEINGTYYRTQSPDSFRRWADETPDGFRFSVKAPRYAVNRAVLAEAGESIQRFFASGVAELGTKLGPILWQLPPTKKFIADDMAAFLDLLPEHVDGNTLRHAVEVRHPTFSDPEFIAMMRKAGAAIVYADSDKYPAIADLTGDIVYARLQRAREEIETGYASDELDAWAARAQAWAAGEAPDDLPLIAGPAARKKRRDVYIYMINGAKIRAPAAATMLIEKIG